MTEDRERLRTLAEQINALTDGEMRDLFDFFLSDDAVDKVCDQVREDILDEYY